MALPDGGMIDPAEVNPFLESFVGLRCTDVIRRYYLFNHDAPEADDTAFIFGDKVLDPRGP